MSNVVNMYEAKTHLSRLVDRAAAGEEIVIAKGGRPWARLVPLARPTTAPREPGGWEQGLSWTDDFDSPLPDGLLAAFEGGPK